VRFAYVVLGEDGTKVTVTVTVHFLAAANSNGATGSGNGSTLTAGSSLPHTGAGVGLVGLAGLLLLSLGIAAAWFGRSRRTGTCTGWVTPEGSLRLPA
jgi:LPXTG-motif cell wall-anchored protein